jgi:ABC-type nickel/cobalt efflux system permease component RcnA
VAGVLAVPRAADAHPLGNATVNHYDGLLLFPDHVEDLAVEDAAEIPTLQRKPLIDGDGNGVLSPAELANYGHHQCASLAAADSLTVGRARLQLRVTSAEYSQLPGAIGLSTGRLVCQLTATADLTGSVTVTIDDRWDGAGIGWHELTAVGRGVALRDSPVPAASISDELRRYPNDLLSSPLDQRGATIAVVPGAGSSTYRAARGLAGAGRVERLLNDLTATFDRLVGSRHLTVWIGLLAVLLAMVLGAGHAFLPGHGKTVMAAYLVGKRGRYRDVVIVGATVTLTHTAGVLAIGLLLSLSAAVAPTVVVQDLAVLSGIIVAGVGLWLLVAALRRPAPRRVIDDGLEALAAEAIEDGPAPPPPAVSAPALTHAGTVTAHSHSHDHQGGGHRHGSPDGPHSHPDGQHDHSVVQAAPTGAGGFGRKGLIGLGVAGGLVPSPSALLVLLAAIALGRTAFGVVLVLGYGVGMAIAFSAAGLLLVRLRGRISRFTWGHSATWLLTALPILTACLVLVVGVGLVLRAVNGSV